MGLKGPLGAAGATIAAGTDTLKAIKKQRDSSEKTSPKALKFRIRPDEREAQAKKACARKASSSVFERVQCVMASPLLRFLDNLGSPSDISGRRGAAAFEGFKLSGELGYLLNL